MTTATYAWTLAGLLALSAATFGLSFLPLGAAALPVALLIAATKAALIAMIFMHLREHTFAATAALLIGILLTVLLVGMTTLDDVERPAARQGAPRTAGQ